MRAIIAFQVLFLWCCCTQANAQTGKTVLAFASDTQEPMFVERIFLKGDNNVKATALIFGDVIKTRPTAFFILGDVVSVGYRKSKWVNIDRYLSECKAQSIPVYAAPGNHEVLFNARRGMKNFSLRFPDYRPEGYYKIVDSVAIVLLSSNFSKMSAAVVAKQNEWYKLAIKKLSADSSVHFIIVGCHHSPYTNSKIVQPSEGVRKYFLPAFIQSKKCVLFLSGHSHNFEHFIVNDKNFLVIGGGGGIHQPLNLLQQRTPDLATNYKPEFHYLRIEKNQDTLHIISRRLMPDFSGFRDTVIATVTVLPK